MAGAYCKFCDRRCFVDRVLPADARLRPGESVHLATCPAGAAHDRKQTGYDHTTAANPMTARKDPTVATERTDPLAALVAEMALRDVLSREKAAIVVGQYTARLERRDGQRRVVLYGEWTVDPSAVAATHVPRAAA